MHQKERGLSITFESLYDKYSNMVYRVCLRYTKEVETVEDLFQEIFLKIHTNFDRFNNDSQPSTWIHRIAVNHCIDYYRKRNRSKEDNVEYLEDIFQDHKFMTAGQNDAKIMVDAIFKELDSELKEMIVLAFVEGLAHHEIAEKLNKDRSTVSKKIRRFQAEIKKRQEFIFKTVVLVVFFGLLLASLILLSPNSDLNRLVMISEKQQEVV